LPVVPLARNTVDFAPPGTNARVQAPDMGAGGEMVGRALERVGGELDQAAHVQDEISNQFDMAAAKEAATHQTQFYTDTAYDPKTGFYGRRGKDALEASEPFKKSLDDNLENLRKGLKSPRQQRYFDQIISPQMNSWHAKAGEFVSDQQLTYSVDQANARADTSLDAATRIYGDDADQGEKQLSTALGEIEHVGRLKGESDEWIQSKQAEASNKAFAVIATQKGIADPVGAVAFVEGHKDRMDPKTVAVLEESLRPRVQKQQGLALADALSGAPTQSDPLAPRPNGEKALDPKAFFKQFTLPHEGGYAPHDANGAPVKYGVNQAANPGVDVKHLTEDQAAQIFTEKYWNKSGAARLSPALAAAHADTYFINPGEADKILHASGGDVNRYMTLREGWMRSLVDKNPAKFAKYERAWSNRNRDLRTYAGGLATGVMGTPSVNPRLTFAEQLQELDKVDAPPEVKSAAREELSQRAQAASIIQTQEHNSWLNTFELQLHDGSAGQAEIESARKSGRLTDYDEVSRLENIVQARQKDGEDMALFSTMMGDPHFGFNQYDDSQRKAVEVGVKALGGTAEAAFDVWQKTGILAKTGAVALRGGLVSTNAQAVQASANIAGNMLRKNPNAFAGVEGESDIEHAAVAFNHYVYDLGMAPKDAAGHVAQENDPKFKAKVALTDPQRQESLKQLRQQGVDAAQFLKGSFPNDTLRGAANQAFHELIVDNLAKGSPNLGVAMTQAAHQLEKVWGVNSHGSIVPYPPEKGYPPIRGGWDYVYADAKETVRQMTGAEPTKFNLVPIPGITDQDFRSGQPPRYRLLYTHKVHGQDIVDTLPGEFAADVAAAKKGQSETDRRRFGQERRHAIDVQRTNEERNRGPGAFMTATP
jgi:hypothetical protein